MKHLRSRILVLVGVVFVLTSALSTISAQNAPGPDSPTGYKVAGVEVHVHVEDEMLRVALSAETTGWISIGFDPSHQMADANIIIAYVKDGELHIADDYGTGPMSHDRDTAHGGTNDIVAATGREEEGVTAVEFTIPLDSGDDLDKPLVPGNTYVGLVAHGPDGADDFTTYHANRGSFELEL